MMWVGSCPYRDKLDYHDAVKRSSLFVVRSTDEEIKKRIYKIVNQLSIVDSSFRPKLDSIFPPFTSAANKVDPDSVFNTNWPNRRTGFFSRRNLNWRFRRFFDVYVTFYDVFQLLGFARECLAYFRRTFLQHESGELGEFVVESLPVLIPADFVEIKSCPSNVLDQTKPASASTL